MNMKMQWSNLFGTVLILGSVLALSATSDGVTKSASLTNRSEGWPDSLYLQAKHMITTAYRDMNLPALVNARHVLERQLEVERNDYLLLYYMGLANYRIGLFYFMQPDVREEAKPYFEQAVQYLERSEKLKKDFSENYILLASVTGLKIGLSPMSAPILGMQAENFLEKARKIDPHNPRLYLIEAISARFKPAFFGGGKEKAVEKCLQAIEAWKTHRELTPIHPDWGYDEAYEWLIRIHLNAGEFELAERYIAEALKVEPGNRWVKEVLQRQLASRKSAKTKQ